MRIRYWSSDVCSSDLRPECVLVVAGDGVEGAELRRLAAQLGIAERTRFLGHVEDVPAVLRALDIFALSSDTEQMPNSLLQAMAAARPVAAVDVGDLSRIRSEERRVGNEWGRTGRFRWPPDHKKKNK